MFARVRGCTGKTSGSVTAISVERAQHLCQAHGVVDQPGPVQRDQAVRAGQPELLPHREGARAFEARQQAVDHDVADAVDPARVDALGAEAGVGVGGRREQPRGDGVDREAVDLLGHRPVEGSQARFDVRDRYPAFRRHQRARERRVDVADDDDLVGGIGLQPLVEAGHHPSGLHRVVRRADFEVDVGRTQAEVGEQRFRHRPVVVLPGVHEHRVDAGAREALEQGRDLHEVRPRSRDHDRPHRRAFQRSRIVMRMNAVFV